MASFVITGLVLLLLIVGWFLVRATCVSPAAVMKGQPPLQMSTTIGPTRNIMEHYWGEHLHAGYYGNPTVKKDFIQAKVDFIDEMIGVGGSANQPHPDAASRKTGTISRRVNPSASLMWLRDGRQCAASGTALAQNLAGYWRHHLKSADRTCCCPCPPAKSGTMACDGM